jgi:hypothetical protein
MIILFSLHFRLQEGPIIEPRDRRMSTAPLAACPALSDHAAGQCNLASNYLAASPYFY